MLKVTANYTPTLDEHVSLTMLFSVQDERLVESSISWNWSSNCTTHRRIESTRQPSQRQSPSTNQLNKSRVARYYELSTTLQKPVPVKASILNNTDHLTVPIVNNALDSNWIPKETTKVD